MESRNDTPTPPPPSSGIAIPFGLIGLLIGVAAGYGYVRVTGYG